MSKHFGFILVVGLSAFLCAGLASAALPAYYVTNIGQLPDQNDYGISGDALSSSGNYVAGIGTYGSDPAMQTAMGFCYNGSAVNPLSSYVGNTNQWYWTLAPIPETIGLQPCGVNSSGTVVGQYLFNGVGSPFYCTAGSTTPTQILPGVLDGGVAYAINDSGVVVGDYGNGGGYSGYMYNIHTQALSYLPFAALSITNTGLMAGCEGGGMMQDAGNGVWQDASGVVHQIPSLIQANAVDSTGTYVCGISNYGVFSKDFMPAVYNTATGQTTAIAIDNGGNDCAYSVNSSGVVVGASAAIVTGDDTQGYVYSNAFVYADGVSHYVGDLTLGGAPSGVIWTTATSIDNAGQILVQGVVGTRPGVPSTFILNPALPGDANLDGRVDINDLTIVLSHYGQTGMTWSQGEFTGDGTVDINDLTIVLAHYNDSVGSSAAAVAAVPEPSCLVLLGIGGIGLLAWLWRKWW